MSAPYRGRRVVFGTRHGKEQQAAGPFAAILGAEIVAPPDLDTDRFGTFSGEVPRTLTPVAAARAKARLALDATGERLALASEASYGPLPGVGWPGHEELLLFVDAERGIEVVEVHRAPGVPGRTATVRNLAELDHALEVALDGALTLAADFPGGGTNNGAGDPPAGGTNSGAGGTSSGGISRVASGGVGTTDAFAQALIVRPEGVSLRRLCTESGRDSVHSVSTSPPGGAPAASTATLAAASAPATSAGVVKGITERDELARAVRLAIAASPTGVAIVEPDLRAHHNPSRRLVLAELARQLATRLATPCPACGAPGFGRVDVVLGLPCADCGSPSELAAADVLGCPACEERHSVPRPGSADPQWCARCNP